MRRRRLADQLDQELQQLLGGPAPDHERSREAHGQARAGSSKPTWSTRATSRRPTSRTGLESVLSDDRAKTRRPQSHWETAGMRRFIGIDLGSTTTKAVLMNENLPTPRPGHHESSRSNYDTASSRGEAGGDHRRPPRRSAARELAEIPRALRNRRARPAASPTLGALPSATSSSSNSMARSGDDDLRRKIARLRSVRRPQAEEAIKEASRPRLFLRLLRWMRPIRSSSPPGAERKSDFFPRHSPARGYCGACPRPRSAPGNRLDYDLLLNGLYDKSIIEVENCGRRRREPAAASSSARSTEVLGSAAEPGMVPPDRSSRRPVANAASGYRARRELRGRHRLRPGHPALLSKEHIRSEILCHGLGAHMMYPEDAPRCSTSAARTPRASRSTTRASSRSFQMNDRCAAGCGRYLGYIADEMNLGLHELGPDGHARRPGGPDQFLDLHRVRRRRASRPPGARRPKREDILAGLHRAIILRAMSIIARSGGIRRRIHLHRRRRQERSGVRSFSEAGRARTTARSPST